MKYSSSEGKLVRACGWVNLGPTGAIDHISHHSRRRQVRKGGRAHHIVCDLHIALVEPISELLCDLGQVPGALLLQVSLTACMSSLRGDEDLLLDFVGQLWLLLTPHVV